MSPFLPSTGSEHYHLYSLRLKVYPLSIVLNGFRLYCLGLLFGCLLKLELEIVDRCFDSMIGKLSVVEVCIYCSCQFLSMYSFRE